MRILLTGGCGFIGSAVVRRLIRQTGHEVTTLDKMTYAASRDALEEAHGHERHRIIEADVADGRAVRDAFAALNVHCRKGRKKFREMLAPVLRQGLQL